MVVYPPSTLPVNSAFFLVPQHQSICHSIFCIVSNTSLFTVPFSTCPIKPGFLHLGSSLHGQTRTITWNHFPPYSTSNEPSRECTPLPGSLCPLLIARQAPAYELTPEAHNLSSFLLSKHSLSSNISKKWCQFTSHHNVLSSKHTHRRSHLVLHPLIHDYGSCSS